MPPKSDSVFISCLRSLVFLGVIFLSNGIYAQSTKYIINWFTDSEGLPQNSIKDIIPDKYGYVWLSTENGIVRYDGRDFKIFNGNNHKDFSDSRMLYFDGPIEKDSIFIYNAQGEEFLIHKNGIEKWQDNATDDDFRDFLKIQLKKYPGNKIKYPDRNTEITYKGRLRFLIGNDSIREYNGDKTVLGSTYHPTLIGDQFFTLGDRLYVLKDNKDIFRIEGKALEKVSSDIYFNMGDIHINDNIDQVFLFADNKVYLLREESGSIRTELMLDYMDFTSLEVYSIYYDPINHIFYIGTSAMGLCVVKEKVFQTIFSDSNDQNAVEYALVAINDSTLLTPSGARIINGTYKDNIKFGDETSPYLMVSDRDGHIWLKEYHKLYRYNRGSNYTTFDSWTFDQDISSLNLLENDLWLSTYDIVEKKGGLFRMDVLSPSPIPEKVVDQKMQATCVVDDGQGGILIGSFSGLFKLDRTNRDAVLYKVEGLGTPEVRSMYRTDADIWITTYGRGIFLYRDGNIASFPIDRNGYLATSHCIGEDDNGYFWISTNKGLFQVAKKALYDYADNKIADVYYQYYDKSAGFYTNEFNGGCSPCMVLQANGQFLYPSLKGIVSFNPNAVSPRLPKYEIFLDGITFGGRTIRPDQHLTIDRKTERITFHFSSPHYGNPYNNEIMVKLKGKDDYQWTYLNKEGNISYTSLPPGNYSLMARRMSGFDSFYSSKTFEFRIEPAFWQTAWFIGGAVLLVLYLIYSGIQIRLRYARHKHILLERKISERTFQLKSTVIALRRTRNDLNDQVFNYKKLLASLTHDIRSPLKYLSLMGRHIHENLDEGKESIGINARSIHTSSSQLIQYIDDLLEYTKVSVDLKETTARSFNIFELINEKTSIFENILILRKITVLNEIEEHLDIPMNRQLFAIIIHNLFDNAIKNTYNGVIVFKYRHNGTNGIFTITDTGLGMPPDKLKHYQDMLTNYDAEMMESNKDWDKGYGMGIIAEILIIMDIKIKIESRLGRGTRIGLYFNI